MPWTIDQINRDDQIRPACWSQFLQTRHPRYLTPQARRWVRLWFQIYPQDKSSQRKVEGNLTYAMLYQLTTR